MKLVYFSSKHDESCKLKLLHSISRALPGLEIQSFENIGHLQDWLQVSPRSFFAAVLEPHDSTTLIELVKLKEYLNDRKLILHLPSDSRQCFSYSSKLTPRCILAAGDGKEAIISVLGKWLRSEGNQVGVMH